MRKRINPFKGFRLTKRRLLRSPHDPNFVSGWWSRSDTWKPLKFVFQVTGRKIDISLISSSNLFCRIKSFSTFAGEDLRRKFDFHSRCSGMKPKTERGEIFYDLRHQSYWTTLTPYLMHAGETCLLCCGCGWKTKSLSLTFTWIIWWIVSNFFPFFVDNLETSSAGQCCWTSSSTSRSPSPFSTSASFWA